MTKKDQVRLFEGMQTQNDIADKMRNDLELKVFSLEDQL